MRLPRTLRSVKDALATSGLGFGTVDEPLEIVHGAGKLRNGIYLRAIKLYRDRISFEVYASRPFRARELAKVTLTDGAGTEYEMVSPTEGDVIEGRCCIAFSPAPPAGVNFHLSEPGWGLHSLGRQGVRDSEP